MTKTLRGLTFDMDSTMSGISNNLETLWNIKMTLDDLRDDMDNVKEEDICFHYREYHRSVQIVTDLMRYTMTELGEYHKEACDIQSSMWDKIVKSDEKKAPAVTGADSVYA